MGLLKAIVGKVDLDGSGFERGAIKVENAAKRLGKSVAHELAGSAAGVFGAFKVTALIQGAIESVSRIRQLSNEFRVSTDTIQIWDRAAHKAGQSAEDIGTAYNRAKKAREAAIGGDKNAANAFGKFGVSMETLKDASKDTETILNQMVNSVSGRRIMDDEDVAGMEIFGKSGALTLSTFQALHSLGPLNLISKEDIENMHKLTKNLDDLERDATVGTSMMIGPVYKALNIGGQTLGHFWEVIRGREKLSQARDNLMMAAYELDQDDETGEAHANERDQHHATSAIVDLHKDDAEIARERLALGEKILQNQLAAMTVTEREAVLKKELADAEDRATRAMIQGNDLEAVRAAKEAEGLRSQLIATDKKGGAALHVDSLNRIGGFVGSAENVSAAIERDKLNTMQRIHKTTGDILRQLSTQYPESLIK